MPYLSTTPTTLTTPPPEYIPPPEAQAPPAEPAPAPQQAAPPPEPAPAPQPQPQAQPQQQAAPPPGDVLSGPARQSSAPSQEQPLTQVYEASEPAPSTGSPTDAIGATAAQIPGAILSGPARGKELAQAAPAAVQEFAAGQQERVYRPGDPDVTGLGAELYQAGETAADQGLADAVAQGPGNLGNILGAAKDVGLSKLASNQGQISPESGGNYRAMMDAAYYAKTHDGQWPAWADQPQLVLPNGLPLSPSFKTNYENDPVITSILNDPDPNYVRAYEEGFTTADGTVYAPGPDAMQAYHAEGRSGLQTAMSDLTTAPLGTLADIGATVLTAGGAKLATEAAEQTGRLGAQTAGKQIMGTGMQVAGRGIDAAATMGLSEAVPGAFTALGKGYRALPWLSKPTTSAAQAEAVETVGEAGGDVLANVRLAQGQQGVPGIPTPSHVTQPTGDARVFRVSMPGDAASAPADLTYHVNKDGAVDGVYDVVLPRPGLDRYRPITLADANQVYDLWGRLPPADRQQVRQAFFPSLTRLESSPGEPFIEQAAEKVFDRQGNLIGDTGRGGAGYQREVDDLRRTILADSRPERIVTDFTTSWKKTLYDGTLHPLTRLPQATHRLQTLKDVMAGLPASYRTPEIQRHIRQMESLLPTQPPAIGTGLKWRGPLAPPKGGQGPQGGLIPASAREQSWLTEMAALPTKAFTTKGLAGGRVGGQTNVNIIFDRKPTPNAGEAYQNGYTTYLDLMDFRLKNGVSGRSDLGELVAEINGLRIAPPTKATQAREDAIKEALERSGLIPGASLMDADQVVFAVAHHLRRTQPTFPPLPGAALAPPAGVYPVGSQSELWGMALDAKLEDDLNIQIDISGTARTAGQRLRTHWEETAKAYELAKQQAIGVTPSPPDARLLDKQVKAIAARFPGEYEKLTATQLAKLSPEEVDRIAVALLKADMQISQGVRSATGRMLTPAETKGLVGRGLGVYDKFIALWRSTVLYNVARGITYPMMQAVGNLITLGIANPGAIPYYLNPKQWKRSFSYLRNPEIVGVPTIIDHLDRVGMGRSANLGRVSRDQLGPRTAYNQVDSHGITKAIGYVLGNQAIKDVADSIDLTLRHSLMSTLWEPAYRRLKRDLGPMAEQRFQRAAAAAGVPVPISRPQIDAALQQLTASTGGYFAQPQLRQALYDAAGGNAAPNRQVVMNAADRLARDYKEELRKIGEVGHAEVNRVAFAGGDSNLEATMQRLFMFTWWVGRASRLYLTEAAKSPVQMALWARAIESGNAQERAGTSGPYKFFQEFMQTPAGYTVSLNPMTLLGTYLLGNTADPTDERSVLTTLGQITEGAVGDNLILAPPLKAALFAIGALGQDARTPDLFGVNRLERELVDALNLANHHLLGFAQTKGGNPERIPYPGVSQGVLNRIAQLISGQVPGTQAVAGYDPNVSPEGQIASFLAEQVQRDNPELDPMDPLDAEQLRHGVDLAMADHDSALYQEALGRYVDSLYQGPLTDKHTAALDVLGAVTRRWVLPIASSVQPTERVERLQRKGRDEQRKAGAQYLSDEGERSELDLRLGMTGARSPEGRELALVRDAALGDPTTQKVKTLADGLKWDDPVELAATFEEVGITQLDLDVNGQRYSFTAEQIALLPEEDRSAIMNYWLDASGMRPVMDGYYENYNAQLQADKAFADGEGWAKYARQYPGGVDAAVDDTALINPNFKRFIEGDVIVAGERVHLPDMRVTDHEAWVAQVTQYDQVASVIAGVKDSRYGLDIDPKYAGLVSDGGQPLQVGTWLLRENEANAAGTDSEYVATMRDDFQTVTELGQALDTLDAKWGQTVGTNRAVLAQRLINGEKYPLDLDMKAAVEGLGGSVGTTLDNPYAMGEYLQWSLAQPAGVSADIDAYQQEYWRTKNAERIPQLFQMIATGQVPALTETGAAGDPTAGLTYSGGAVGLGVRPGMATLAAPTILASEPGGPQGVAAPAGMPVRTGQMMTGSDGSTWVYVTSGDGNAGWMNLAGLTPAA